MAGQDPACVIVNPIDGTNLVQGMAQLAANDVPIVNIDSPVDADAAAQADAAPATAAARSSRLMRVAAPQQGEGATVVHDRLRHP